MITIPPSILGTPDTGYEEAPIPRQTASQDPRHEWSFEQSVTDANVSRSLPIRDRFDETVQISPIDSVKRHSKGCNGIIAETVYVPGQSSVRIHYRAPVHLLMLYEDGARREGETSIDGLPPSQLRNFTHKLTFVPAGHSYREWHKTIAPLRVTYLYLSPTKLQKSPPADAAYIPKLFFEDPILWTTAIKLKSALEGNDLRTPYLEALTSVLAHELSCSGREPALVLPRNRGGLAGWQMRAVTAYIEEHLNEQISLLTLARIVRLSQHHFCRAFKRSFGLPPHEYHLQWRIERAKALLSERAHSITDVALILGYSFPSSFSLAFRKVTGQSPSDFRRNIT